MSCPPAPVCCPVLQVGFTGAADFSRASQGLFISEVLHKVYWYWAAELGGLRENEGTKRGALRCRLGRPPGGTRHGAWGGARQMRVLMGWQYM